MLKILSVNPTGFGPYGIHASVPISDCGVVWLVGDNRDKGGSNASGKSFFFNVIAYCLWGKVETVIGGSVSGTEDLSNEVLGVGSCPRVDFLDAAGVLWRVTCSRKWKGTKAQLSPYLRESDLWPYKGSDVFLERWEESLPGWIDERASTSPLTRAKLRKIVDISYERYLVTTYLAQGKGLDFLQGSHADRMAIFTDVMNLGVWDVAAADCKIKRDEATRALQQVQNDHARVQGEMALLSTQIMSDEQVAKLLADMEQLKTDAASAELKKVACEYRAQQLTEQIGAIRVGVNPYIETLRNHTHTTRNVCSELALVIARAYTEVVRVDQAHKEITKQIDGTESPTVRQVQAELDSARVSLANAKRHSADFASGKLTKCPTCKQDLPNKIDGSHLLEEVAKWEGEGERLMQALAAALDALAKQRAALRADEVARYEQASKTVREAHAAAEKAHEEKKDETDAQHAAIEAQRDAYDASEESKNVALKELAEERLQAKAQLHAYTQQINQATVFLAQGDAALKTNEENKAKYIDVIARLRVAEMVVTQARIDEVEWIWLLKNLGDKGIKAYKLDTICQRLNELISDALADIDSSFQLWVKPYRLRPGVENKPEELLTSDDVVADITVLVQEGKKKAVPLYLYSGGEASLVAIALLVAMWQLADEQGSGTNLLLLDEVVGFLDERNSQVIVRFLEGLKTAGKTVIAVSHSQVVDSVNFDAVWRAEKSGGITRIVQ